MSVDSAIWGSGPLCLLVIALRARRRIDSRRQRKSSWLTARSKATSSACDCLSVSMVFSGLGRLAGISRTAERILSSANWRIAAARRPSAASLAWSLRFVRPGVILKYSAFWVLGVSGRTVILASCGLCYRGDRVSQPNHCVYERDYDDIHDDKQFDDVSEIGWFAHCTECGY